MVIVAPMSGSVVELVVVDSVVELVVVIGHGQSSVTACPTAFFRHVSASVAVVGVPDARWGEVGHAFVVLAPGGSAGPEALLAHLRERLARYKVPKRLTRLDAMPFTAAGKVLKTELRRLAAEAVKAEGSP